MPTIVFSDELPDGLMTGIDDERDHNTHVKLILGVDCDDFNTLPDDNTHPIDSPAGDELKLCERYGDSRVELFSCTPLGVLRWLDTVRESVATSARYHYARLKSDAPLGDEEASRLAAFECGARENGYHIILDEDALGGCRLEPMPLEEWYDIRFPEQVS